MITHWLNYMFSKSKNWMCRNCFHMLVIVNEGKQDVIENLNVLLLILVLTLYGLFGENQIWWNDNLQICCKPLNYIHCQISPTQYIYW